MADLYAYTDGACSGNPGPGGWGVWMLARDGAGIARTGTVGIGVKVSHAAPKSFGKDLQISSKKFGSHWVPQQFWHLEFDGFDGGFNQFHRHDIARPERIDDLVHQFLGR